ncbi:MAG: glycosyltransferase [Alphaproteobacteria bacterium]|nr:glycosyltransferase [Alphaproteobacteria bacterium]
MKARIFYVAKPFGVPLGGIATIFRHVEILVRHGFDASIYLLPGEGGVFFRHDAPIFDARGQLDTRATDVFVLPEAWVGHLPDILALPVRKYVFCQNHFYVFAGIAGTQDYRAVGIEGVLASSRVIAGFLERDCGATDVAVVPYAIDGELFRPRVKRRQIAFMPRKLSIEADFMRGLFARRHPVFADIPWIAIDGRPIDEVARHFGESRWFLSLSHLEGFGLPPVEAMAAEAIVVGFHGEGGLEYATRANGFWCPTGDLDGCVAALARAVAASDAGLDAPMLAAGRRTAAIYNAEAQERSLIDFWARVLDRDPHQLRHISR